MKDELTTTISISNDQEIIIGMTGSISAHSPGIAGRADAADNASLHQQPPVLNVPAQQPSSPHPSRAPSLLESPATNNAQSISDAASIKATEPAKDRNRENRQLLLEAAQTGNEAEVERLLAQGVPIEHKSPMDETALHLASRFGRKAVVELLLDHKADVEARDVDGWVPLYGAAWVGEPDVVALLLGRGSSVNARMPLGWTPLTAAVEHGGHSTVKLLLDKGADIHVQSDDRTTPLSLACIRSDIEIVHLLLDRGAQVNHVDAEGWTPLLIAASHAKDEVCRLLLDHGALVNPNLEKWMSTPLHIACQNPGTTIVSVLLEKGALVDARNLADRTPLHVAACNGDQNMLKVLIEHGADVNAVDEDGYSALHWISSNDAKAERVPMLRMLMDKNAKVLATKTFEHTPLHKASQDGRLDVVQILLQVEGLINLKDGTGWTALHLASYGGHGDVIDALLAAGALPSIKTEDDKKTPLMVAIDALAGDVMEDQDRRENCLKAVVSLAKRSDAKERKYAIRRCTKQEDLEQILSRADFEEADVQEIKLVWFAAREDKHPLLCEMLKEDNVEGETKPATALEWAAYHGNPAVTWWILNTNQPDASDRAKAKMIAESRSRLFTTRNLSVSQPAQDEKTASNVEGPGLRTPAPGEVSRGKDQTLQQKPSPTGATKQIQRKGKQEIEGYTLTVDMLRDPPLVSGLPGKRDPYKLPPISLSQQQLIADFSGTIVDFYSGDGRVDFLRRQREVFKVIYDQNQGPKKIMEEARATLGRISYNPDGEKVYKEEDLRLRWIHLEANNMAWMEDLTKRIYLDKEKPKDEYYSLMDFMRKSWQEVSTAGSKASFMKPLCIKSPPVPKAARTESTHDEATQTSTQQPPTTADEQVEATLDIKDADGATQTLDPAEEELGNEVPTGATAGALAADLKALPVEQAPAADKPETYQRVALYMPYITFGHCYHASEDDPSKSDYQKLCNIYKDQPLHRSRSLDQFYYHSLSDMKDRDAGQVATRFLMRSLRKSDVDSQSPEDIELPDPWPILTVDQLWLWVIDEDTIITCSSNRSEKLEDPVMEKIFNYLREERGRGKGQPPPSSVEELSEFIVNFCIDLVEHKHWNVNTEEHSAHQIFADTINQKGAEEAILFKAFTKKTKRKREESRHAKTKRALTLKDSLETEDWKAISKAAELLEEVKDIRDELNILKSLLTDQKNVWKGMFATASEVVGEKGAFYILNGIEEMDQTSSAIQTSVNDILSLEQNGINITEAVLSRESADESIRQGRTLMIFTIVTIIFLPLSFFTSLFALNITSFQHDSKGNLLYQPGWIFPILFCTSFAIITLLVACAFNFDRLVELVTGSPPNAQSADYGDSLATPSMSNLKGNPGPQRSRRVRFSSKMWHSSKIGTEATKETLLDSSVPTNGTASEPRLTRRRSLLGGSKPPPPKDEVMV